MTTLVRAAAPPYVWIQPHLWELLNTMCDWIVPSAWEAAVPEWIAFVCDRDIDLRYKMLGGLCWIDYRAIKQYSLPFCSCDQKQQEQIVSTVSSRANGDLNPGLLPGIQFFASLRAWTLTAFFTSRAGHAALGYLGNTPRNAYVPCPQVRPHFKVL